MRHELYETQDEDKPLSICDRNGEVALGLCRVCGGAECSLTTSCPGRQLTEIEETQICKGNLDFINGIGWTMSPDATDATLLDAAGEGE